MDYRGLIAITTSERYSLPLFKETVRHLRKAKWYTRPDFKSAFHRLQIKEGDRQMTAFRCRLGPFEWLITPFGLINSTASFQRYVNENLHE